MLTACLRAIAAANTQVHSYDDIAPRPAAARSRRHSVRSCRAACPFLARQRQLRARRTWSAVTQPARCRQRASILVFRQRPARATAAIVACSVPRGVCEERVTLRSLGRPLPPGGSSDRRPPLLQPALIVANVRLATAPVASRRRHPCLVRCGQKEHEVSAGGRPGAVDRVRAHACRRALRTLPPTSMRNVCFLSLSDIPPVWMQA